MCGIVQKRASCGAQRAAWRSTASVAQVELPDEGFRSSGSLLLLASDGTTVAALVVRTEDSYRRSWTVARVGEEAPHPASLSYEMGGGNLRGV